MTTRCTCYTPPKWADPGEVYVCPNCEQAMADVDESLFDHAVTGQGTASPLDGKDSGR